MTHPAASGRSAGRPFRSSGVGLALVVAATIGLAVARSGLSSVPVVGAVRGSADRGGTTAEAGDGVTEAGGVLPDGVTVFDDRYPGVANLDPALLRALREAATAAEGDGIVIVVNSGWRSPTYQEALLRAAVSTYGSERAAARWVATPTTSPHVHGDAVDLGPSDATAWLSRHGAAYGLCRIYRNEPWHFELRPHAIGDGCPATYTDPTHDPRMRA